MSPPGPGQPEAAYTLAGVTRHFSMGQIEVPVLRGIDLEVARGRMTVILGPSGSGKSTLLNLLGGIDRPSAGTIRFGDLELGGLNDRALTMFRRREIGFVFQFYNLVPTLTALENVTVAAEIARQPLDAQELLDLVELGHRRDHFPAQLSGGEQQRVSVARALVKDPSVLLCDEPTGALDRTMGRSVLGLLRSLGQDLGKTVIVVTHNTAIAAIADFVVRLGNGVVESHVHHAHPTPVQELTW